MKTCGLCGFATRDPALFDQHMTEVHRWTAPRGEPRDLAQREQSRTLFVFLLLLVVGVLIAGQLHIGEFWIGLVAIVIAIAGLYVYGWIGRERA